MDLFISPDVVHEFIWFQLKNKARAYEGNQVVDAKQIDNILVVEYNGDMVVEDYHFRRNVGWFVSKVRTEVESGNYTGVIIKLSTYGGYADAANEINNLIKDIRSSGKKVVVYSNYLMSAGIMATLAADRIVAASKFAKFGSIGAFVSIDLYLSELRKKYILDIYADTSPNKNKSYRMFEKDGNVSGYKLELNKVDDVFMSEVKKYRPISVDYNDTLLGGTWMAEESKMRGLVDHVLTLSETIKLIKRI